MDGDLHNRFMQASRTVQRQIRRAASNWEGVDDARRIPLATSLYYSDREQFNMLARARPAVVDADRVNRDVAQITAAWHPRYQQLNATEQRLVDTVAGALAAEVYESVDLACTAAATMLFFERRTLFNAYLRQAFARERPEDSLRLYEEARPALQEFMRKVGDYLRYLDPTLSGRTCVASTSGIAPNLTGSFAWRRSGSERGSKQQTATPRR